MTSKIFIRLDHISKDYFLFYLLRQNHLLQIFVKNSALSSPVIRITTTYPSGVNKETLLLLSLFWFYYYVPDKLVYYYLVKLVFIHNILCALFESNTSFLLLLLLLLLKSMVKMSSIEFNDNIMTSYNFFLTIFSFK